MHLEDEAADVDGLQDEQEADDDDAHGEWKGLGCQVIHHGERRAFPNKI